MPARIIHNEGTSRKYRRGLRDLTEAVSAALRMLDAEMKLPTSPERGSRIARICNGLQMSNDCAKRFALGLDWNGRPFKETRSGQ